MVCCVNKNVSQTLQSNVLENQLLLVTPIVSSFVIIRKYTGLKQTIWWGAMDQILYSEVIFSGHANIYCFAACHHRQLRCTKKVIRSIRTWDRVAIHEMHWTISTSWTKQILSFIVSTVLEWKRHYSLNWFGALFIQLSRFVLGYIFYH